MNRDNSSFSVCRPIKAVLSQQLENSGRACVYGPDDGVDGVEGVERLRGVLGVPVICTRCLGVIGSCLDSASR